MVSVRQLIVELIENTKIFCDVAIAISDIESILLIDHVSWKIVDWGDYIVIFRNIVFVIWDIEDDKIENVKLSNVTTDMSGVIT